MLDRGIFVGSNGDIVGAAKPSTDRSERQYNGGLHVVSKVFSAGSI
jgi:hypothetical protein